MANNQVANLALHRQWYDLSALLDQQSQAQLSLRRCITQEQVLDSSNDDWYGDAPSGQQNAWKLFFYRR